MKLSPREAEVAQCVGMGLSNKEIANVLGMAVNTVKHHLTRVFVKTGARSRTQLALQLQHRELLK